jgi:hypothetical protein
MKTKELKDHVKAISKELCLENSPNLYLYIGGMSSNYYDPNTNEISIDINSAISVSNGYNVFNDIRLVRSIAHEMRHAYQCLQGHSFEGYTSAEEDISTYRNQPCEVDARKYATEYIEKAFGVDDCEYYLSDFYSYL